ncbi:MAG: DUF3383 domain-containing protein [bacterium]|nr:DUF3383 domain-containing protein [bacterium]
MPRAITRFIDVAITKGNVSVYGAGFGIPLVITNSSLLTTTSRVKSFTSLSAVATFFGSASEEALLADAYFNQSSSLIYQPETLKFGRFASADTSAVIECGNTPETDFEVWKLITDGEFGITIDGTLDDVDSLDFSSVTSLDDVATVITAGLTQGTCTWNQENRFVVESPTTGATSLITLLDTVAVPAGTDISGSGYLAGAVEVGVSTPNGAILSQGQVAETFEVGLTAIQNIDDVWAIMTAEKEFRDVSNTEAMADAIEGRKKIFLIETNDSNVLISGDTSTFSYYVKNLNYLRTGIMYHDNSALYPVASWIGQQAPKPVGSSNWSFKQLAGSADGAASQITAVDLTEGQKSAALEVNCNLYCSTLGKTFTFFGTMGGGKNDDKDGEYIDVVRNIDYLQSVVEDTLMDLLLEKEIIPYTNAGITIVDNSLKDVLQRQGVDTGILVDETIVTFFPKRSDVDQTDRDDRLLPDGTFEADLQGAINRIVVRGTLAV